MMGHRIFQLEFHHLQLCNRLTRLGSLLVLEGRDQVNLRNSISIDVDL